MRSIWLQVLHLKKLLSVYFYASKSVVAIKRHCEMKQQVSVTLSNNRIFSFHNNIF